MKKAAVFSMAAFYLLLTTGMFVCIVHCAAESMVKKPAMAMAHNHDHQPKKHCGNGSGCDCCKQHGAYVVKENLKPGFNYQFSPTAVLIAFAVPEGLFTTKQQVTNYCWTDTKAPPGKSGKALSIQLRSLQI
jgi:bacterioferritin-associated ferredoxin